MAETQLQNAVNISFASRWLKKAKIGLIGYQAPGFQDFHPDPFTMRKTFGSLLLQIGLNDYTNLAKSVDGSEVRENVDRMLTALNNTSFSDHDIEPAMRHYTAMKKLIADNNLDALAIQCWPELPAPECSGGLDQWCYMALAKLATEGFPIACEGDVDGALGSLMGKLLGCGAIYLSDWLEHDVSTLTLWHGGMAPFQLSEAVGTPLGPCISRHFNNRKPGCLDATIKIGIPVTVFRVWVFNHRYHAIVLEGQTVKPKRHLLGNNGLVNFGPNVNLVTAFQRWLQTGFPHHVCVVQGHHKERMAAFLHMKNVALLENN